MNTQTMAMQEFGKSKIYFPVQTGKAVLTKEVSITINSTCSGASWHHRQHTIASHCRN